MDSVPFFCIPARRAAPPIVSFFRLLRPRSLLTPSFPLPASLPLLNRWVMCPLPFHLLTLWILYSSTRRQDCPNFLPLYTSPISPRTTKGLLFFPIMNSQQKRVFGSEPSHSVFRCSARAFAGCFCLRCLCEANWRRGLSPFLPRLFLRTAPPPQSRIPICLAQNPFLPRRLPRKPHLSLLSPALFRSSGLPFIHKLVFF